MAIVEVVARPDATPCPYVEVVVRELAGSVSTVTVWRTSGGAPERVRGAVDLPVTDSLSRVDFEAPFGVAIQYRAELFSSTGQSLGWSQPADVVLEVDDTWVHNCLAPAGATRVAFRGNAAREISRPVQGEQVRVLGKADVTVVGSGRAGVTDVTLDVITDDLDSADRMAAMLGDQETTLVPVLCFRVGAKDRVRLPRPFYAAVMDIKESDFSSNLAHGTGEKITHAMTGTQASPPIPGLFIPLLTRDHIDAYYASRDAIDADNQTRLGLDRRYDLVR